MIKNHFIIFCLLFYSNCFSSPINQKNKIEKDSIVKTIEDVLYTQGHFMSKNTDSIKKYTTYGIKLATSIKDYSYIIQFKKNLAKHYHNTGQNTLSCNLFNEVLEQAKAHDVKKEIIIAYSNISYCYIREYKYFEALQSLRKSLKTLEFYKSNFADNFVKQQQFYSNYNIAYIYFVTKNYDLSLSKLGELEQQSINNFTLSVTYSLFGQNYEKTEDFDNSLTYYLKSLQFFDKKNNISKLNEAYLEVVFLLLKKQDLITAQSYLKKIDSIDKNTPYKIKNNQTDLCKANYAKGYIALKNKDYKKANSYLTEAKNDSKDIMNLDVALNIYKSLYQLSVVKNKVKDIVKYSQKCLDLTDSITSLDRDLAFYREKLTFELNELEKKKEIEFTKEKSEIVSNSLISQRNIIIGFLMTILLISVFLFITKTKLKNSYKKLTKTVKDKEFLEKKFENIETYLAKDLHDNFGNRLAGIINSYEIIKELKESGKDQYDENFTRFSSFLEKSIKGLVEDVKDFIWIMDKDNNNLIRLIDKVLSFTDYISKSSNIKISHHIDLDKDDYKLHKLWNRQLLLIIKEAVNNTLKHSDATIIKISFQVNKDKMLIAQCQDNGKGFNKDNVDRFSGLINMGKRAESLGCKLAIDSQINKGTTITFKGKIP